jgi:glycosyltransferase involved in cell wall biosynthesis
VYDGASHLRAAIDSLLRQTYADFVLVISDNASQDDTETICREYAAADSRVRYTRRVATVDATINFNDLLEQASSEYFMWAACDDTWDNTFLATAVDLLAQNPSRVTAFTRFDNIDEEGRCVRNYTRIVELGRDGSRVRRLLRMLWFPEHEGKANIIYGLMRTRQLQAIGGAVLYSGNLWGVDCLLVFRLASLGPVAVSRELLFHKRLPEGARTGVPRWLARVPSLVPREYLDDYRYQLDFLPVNAGERAVLLVALRLRIEQNRLLEVVARTYRWWRRRGRKLRPLVES